MTRGKVHILEKVLCFILLFLTIFSPKGFSYNFCISVFVICIIGVVLYFKYWQKEMVNFLDFEPIFIIVSVIMGFTFPLLIYSNDSSTAYFFSWNIPYSLDYFNKGASLWALGIVSFMAGSTSKIYYRPNVISKHTLVKTHRLIFFVWVFILFIYVIAGGFTRYQYIYQEEDFSNPFLSYLEVFIVALSEVVLANEFWNKLKNKYYKIDKINIGIVLLVALTYLFVGNRTISLYLIVPIVFFVAVNFFKIKLIPFILALCLGGSLMVFMMFFRTGGGFIQNLDWYYYLVDLMNPNTTTYLACEITDKQGYTLGVSQLGPILGVIPFSQSILSSLVGLEPNLTNSSHIFTKFLQAPAGTGTNYISDFYLSFGVVGVLLGTYFFSKILNSVRLKSKDSYYQFVVYIIMMGFAVYGVRSSLLYVIRFILYGVLVSYINLKLQRK